MKYSIIKRLFGGVLALLLPLLALQGGVYLWSRQAVTQEIESSAESNLEYLLKYFEKKVQDIYQSAHTLMEDTHIGMFYTRLAHGTFESNSEYYMSVRDIKSDLDVLKYSSDVIKDVTLLFPLHGVSISSSAYSSFDASDAPRLYEAARRLTPLLMEIEGRLYSVFAKPHEAELERARFLLCIEFDQSAFVDILSSYSQDQGKNSLLYMNASGFLLTSPSAPALSPDQLADLDLFSQEEGISKHMLDVEGKTHSVFLYPSRLLNVCILQTIPMEQLNEVPATIGTLMILLCLATTVVLLLLLRMLLGTVAHPVEALGAAFARAGEGDFSLRLPPQEAQEFDRLSAGFNAMSSHISDLIDTNYRQTIRLQTVELKKLQAQINPHFLYNAFYFLRHLISTEENESAEAFCRYLGRYFQYITRNDHSTISLQEEYAHAVNYLNIQLMRFGDTVRAEIPPLDPALGQILVPRLIVEPMVENCFKHGLNTSEETGHIRISILDETDSVVIVIENNGDDLTDETLSVLARRLELPDDEVSFTGLVNTHHRLKLFFGPPAGIRVARSGLGGLMVTLRVLKTAPRHESETKE